MTEPSMRALRRLPSSSPERSVGHAATWLRLIPALTAFAPFGVYAARLAEHHGAGTAVTQLASSEGMVLAALLALPFVVARGLRIDWAGGHDLPT